MQCDGCGRLSETADRRSAVGQEVLLDVVAVGLEQDVVAAQLTDLLLGPLDHAVALAAVGIQHLAGAGNLEALLGARLGLDLGHLALLCGRGHGPTPGQPVTARLSVLIEHFAVATAALSAGRREAGVMAEAGEKHNRGAASSEPSCPALCRASTSLKLERSQRRGWHRNSGMPEFRTTGSAASRVNRDLR